METEYAVGFRSTVDEAPIVTTGDRCPSVEAAEALAKRRNNHPYWRLLHGQGEWIAVTRLITLWTEVSNDRGNDQE